jgi:hypothetical protein
MLRIPINSLEPTILSFVPRFGIPFEENRVKERSPSNRDHDQKLCRSEATPRTVVRLDCCERCKPALGEIVLD